MPKVVFEKAVARDFWKSDDGVKNGITLLSDVDEWRFSSDKLDFSEIPLMFPISVEVEGRNVRYNDKTTGEAKTFFAVDGISVKVLK